MSQTINKTSEKIDALLNLALDKAKEQLISRDSISSTTGDLIQGLLQYKREDAKPSKSNNKYQLFYTRLDGRKDKYNITEIIGMDSTHLKARVFKKGFRTFILDRVEKLVSI